MYFSTNAISAFASHNSEIQNVLVSKRRTLLCWKVANRTFSGSLVLDVRIWWRRMHTVFADYVHNKNCFTTACKGLFRFLLDRISQRNTLYFVSVLLKLSFCNVYGKHRTRYCLIFWIGIQGLNPRVDIVSYHIRGKITVCWLAETKGIFS